MRKRGKSLTERERGRDSHLKEKNEKGGGRERERVEELQLT